MVAPRFAGMGGHQRARSSTEVWLTPPAVLAAIGGADSFDLDPCAAPEPRPWPTARHHYTEADNGLLLPWFGRVFCNPPYSHGKIGRWLGRMAGHNRGVALIFARTETDAFVRFVWERAAAVLFIRGRLEFHRQDGSVGLRPDGTSASAGAPSVLIAYGSRDADVLAFCGIAGQFVPLLIPRLAIAAAIEQTWMQAVMEWMEDRRGPVRLDDLYRAFAGHHKARRNRHFREKLRQVLQQGPFQRVGRGAWQRV